MWPRTLTGRGSAAGPERTYAVPSADLTCAERDRGKCGVQFSDTVSRARSAAAAAPFLTPRRLRLSPALLRCPISALFPPVLALRAGSAELLLG